MTPGDQQPNDHRPPTDSGIAALLPVLGRIADALDQLAADARARAAQAARAAVAEHERLANEYAAAGNRFNLWERRANRMSFGSRLTDEERAAHNQAEQDMIAAELALRAFEAAHPELPSRQSAIENRWLEEEVNREYGTPREPAGEVAP
jgi:hypothetical protein